MPEISVKLYKGRTDEQKRGFEQQVVSAVVAHLTVPGRSPITAEKIKFSYEELDRPTPAPKPDLTRHA